MATSAHFIVNTLALKRGGLVKAVRERASALAATGALEKVQINVLGIQPRLERDVAALKRDGHLHSAVQVRSVLAALDNSGVDRRTPATGTPEPGVRRYPTDDSGLAFRLFRDGLYERYLRLDKAGTIARIDHMGPARLRFRREDFDGSGRLARIQEFRQGNAAPTVQRLIGRDGSCYATIWQNTGQAQWESVFVHSLDTEFPSTGPLYVKALELLLAEEEAPAICTEFRENLPNLPVENLDDIVRAISHPNLLKLMTIHSNHLEPPYVRGSGIAPNWRRTLDHLDEFDAVVALTPAQREDLVSEVGHAQMISVIGQVAPEPVPMTGIDPLRLVLVARTHPKKRVDEAMRVMARVLSEEPEAVLEVFGFGYGDAEEERVKELITELGIGESVRFMPFAQDTATIYAGACATLLTSASEGFPLILLESMSHGVPVLAYDANYGPRDVIRDGENGFLVPFGGHEALAARVVELIRNPALREAMGRAGQVTLADFGPGAFTERWLELLSRNPRPLRVSGKTIGPVVEVVRPVGNGLELLAAGEVPEGTVLLLADRKRDVPDTRAALKDGRWLLELPELAPGTILDAYVVLDGSRKRIQAGALKPLKTGGWGVYATAGGWLSLKAYALK